MVRTPAELLDVLAAWAPPSDARLQVVLVVNDCQVMLRVESRLFEEGLGVRTIGAETNASALAAALRGRPDVIVSDLVRGGGSGKDFVEALLGYEALRETPVVIFSASARYQKLADWAGTVGVVALRELPAPPEELVDIVAYALGRSTTARWDGPVLRSQAREIALDRRQLPVNVDWRRRRREALASRLRR